MKYMYVYRAQSGDLGWNGQEKQVNFYLITISFCLKGGISPCAYFLSNIFSTSCWIDLISLFNWFFLHYDGRKVVGYIFGI